MASLGAQAAVKHCRVSAFMAEKKALIVSFSDPAEGRLGVALGCVWGPEQALGRGGSLQGSHSLLVLGTGTCTRLSRDWQPCELGQAISEKGASASTVLLPPFELSCYNRESTPKSFAFVI